METPERGNENSPNMTTVTGTQLRESVGTFPSGVTVVATRRDGVDHGLTVSAFISLSLEPAMVLASVESNSRVLPYLEPGSPVAISVLAEDQIDQAVRFGRHIDDKFAGVTVHRAGNDAPLITGAAAWFEGEVADVYLGGDHHIVTILVQDCGDDPERDPLLYQRGRLHPWPEAQEA